MTTTIGFLGQGQVPEALLTALLEDQVSAKEDVDFIIGAEGENAQKLWDFAKANDIGCECKPLDRPEEINKLLVFWDDSEYVRTAVSRALDRGVEVRDLCDALTRIDKILIDKIKELPDVLEIETLYTRDELESQSEQSLIYISEGLGIDHTQFGEWPDLIDHILAQQSPVEDEGWLTKDELKEMELEALKEVVELNGIEDERLIPRARSSTYIEVILDWQDEQKKALEEGPAVATGITEAIQHAFEGPINVPDSNTGMYASAASRDVVEAIKALDVSVQGSSKNLQATLLQHQEDLLAGFEKIMQDAVSKIVTVIAARPSASVSPSPMQITAEKVGANRVRRPGDKIG